jgi:hypothetical protein
MKLFTLLLLLTLSFVAPSNVQAQYNVIDVIAGSLKANKDVEHNSRRHGMLPYSAIAGAGLSRLSTATVAVVTQPPQASSATASPRTPPFTTPSPFVAPEKSGPATRTPRPTATPVTVPPPTDPNRVMMMVAFGFLTVIVVLVGVWINRKNIE